MMMMLIYMLLCSIFLINMYSLATLMIILLNLSSFHLFFFGALPWNSAFSHTDFSFLSVFSLTVMSSIFMLIINLLQNMILMFNKFFSLLILILTILLSFDFTTNSTILFCIWFEASIAPTFFLILGWGNHPERKQASVYMLIYTASSSLF